tara:strand:- start:345 stop:584 length:240 start_codon:yes stop_codon:yes gene_type:complete
LHAFPPDLFAETVFPFTRYFRSLGKEIPLFTSQYKVNPRRFLLPIISQLQNNGNAILICIVVFAVLLTVTLVSDGTLPM